jgi:hypothetical protein
MSIKESSGQTSLSFQCTLSSRINATGAEPRSRMIATSAVKGLIILRETILKCFHEGNVVQPGSGVKRVVLHLY